MRTKILGGIPKYSPEERDFWRAGIRLRRLATPKSLLIVLRSFVLGTGCIISLLGEKHGCTGTGPVRNVRHPAAFHHGFLSL